MIKLRKIVKRYLFFLLLLLLNVLLLILEPKLGREAVSFSLDNLLGFGGLSANKAPKSVKRSYQIEKYQFGRTFSKPTKMSNSKNMIFLALRRVFTEIILLFSS